MPLNPLAFKSFEDFQEARRKEGLRLGWTLRPEVDVLAQGELAVDNILKHRITNPSLVIVAIPAEDDYIHKISSQKVPHMTLLFLGETDKVKNLSKITNFVEHASTQLQRFSLSVDRRGELGSDQADVLFFSDDNWSGLGPVKSFRSNLLKEPNIHTANDSVQQHPEWVPHLTLGYPDTPANPDNRDNPKIYYVEFDRIAIWTDEFEGVEFPLKAQNWDLESDMAMSDTVGIVNNILTHHGVKGQKWGVRKEKEARPPLQGFIKKDVVRKTANGDTFTLSPNPPTILHKGLAKVSEKYRKSYGQGSHLTIKDSNGKKVGQASFWLKGKDDIYLNWVHIEKSSRGRGYASEAMKAAAEHGKATGRKRMVLEVPGNAPDARHIYEKVGFTPTGVTSGNRHDMWGGLTEMEYKFDVKHIDDVVDDILTHHGVKGQKWGVRRDRSSSVTVTDKKKGIKTSGGVGLPAHPDAVRVRTIGQKGKGSGLKALSDKELQDYAKRIQMEQSVKRLNYNEANLGKKFVLTMLGKSGNSQADVAAATQTAKRVKKILVAAAA